MNLMIQGSIGDRVARLLAVVVLAFAAGAVSRASSQTPQAPPPRPTLTGPQQPPTAAEPVEKIGDGLFRIGNVRVDTKKREVSVGGTTNDVQILEFIASTKNGVKGYESAIELDTNAITFNVALILIGLDSKNAVVPAKDRGPDPPRGDHLEVVVQWTVNGESRAVPAEELVVNMKTKEALPKAPWIYTGSALVPKRNVLLADLDGVLIGFMHTRASVIDHGASLRFGYGAYRLNTDLVKPGTPVTVVVKAVATQ
jgi:hypothetical protein